MSLSLERQRNLPDSTENNYLLIQDSKFSPLP